MSEKIISLDTLIQFNPLRKIDFSQEVEIRQTKDGRVFGIKNRRLDVQNQKIIADTTGDEDAAKEYLQHLSESLSNTSNTLEVGKEMNKEISIYEWLADLYEGTASPQQTQKWRKQAENPNFFRIKMLKESIQRIEGYKKESPEKFMDVHENNLQKLKDQLKELYRIEWNKFLAIIRSQRFKESPSNDKDTQEEGEK